MSTARASEPKCRKKKRGEPRKEVAYEASPSSPRKNAATLLVAYLTTTNTTENAWFLDSGATSHVCNSYDAFTDYTPASAIQYIHVGDDHGLKIEGSGSVILAAADIGQLTLTNVLYVPTMVKNLLSICMLISTNDFRLEFNSAGYTLCDKSHNMIIARRTLKAGLYKFSMKSFHQHQTHLTTKPAAAFKTSLSDSVLWHCRLGHVNSQKLKEISKGSLYSPSPKIDASSDFFYESCIFGKHHVLPYVPTSSTKATKLLQLVHTDLCGPMSTSSLGSASY